MAQISLSIPVVGQPDTTEDVKIQNNFTAIQTAINGGLDTTNVTAALAQSAAVNQSGQTVKGSVSIPGSESRSSVAYGTLATPDQVTGIVLPSNGLIRVWYQATWQESVQSAARAAIFLGANQLQVQARTSSSGPQAQAAMLGSVTTGVNVPLFSFVMGLGSPITAGSYSADVSTGQAVGYIGSSVNLEIGGTTSTQVASPTPLGGPCDIFAAAGTYTVSVQFKASSGSVTASARKLWVQAISFA